MTKLIYDFTDAELAERFRAVRASQPAILEEARKTGDFTEVFSAGSSVSVLSSEMTKRLISPARVHMNLHLDLAIEWLRQYDAKVARGQVAA